MKTFLKIKEFVKKLQDLPLWQRKVILWIIIVILGIFLAFFWWNSSKEKLRKINPGESIQGLIPSIEMPDLPEEENNNSN